MSRSGGKYGATKTACNLNHRHASKLEAKRCNDLHLLERAGEISALNVEPQYWFAPNGIQLKHDNGRRIGYKPDFVYVEQGKLVAEDCKGFHARDWPLRKAFFQMCFPAIELREIRA